ncbi:hypothetical protein NX059_001913 [Plenodomus lindquistii]|nr:hypothetical protein NX059_001913 [Plenodomus lindquistii]
MDVSRTRMTTWSTRNSNPLYDVRPPSSFESVGLGTQDNAYVASSHTGNSGDSPDESDGNPSNGSDGEGESGSENEGDREGGDNGDEDGRDTITAQDIGQKKRYKDADKHRSNRRYTSKLKIGREILSTIADSEGNESAEEAPTSKRKATTKSTQPAKKQKQTRHAVSSTLGVRPMTVDGMLTEFPTRLAKISKSFMYFGAHNSGFLVRFDAKTVELSGFIKLVLGVQHGASSPRTIEAQQEIFRMLNMVPTIGKSRNFIYHMQT